MARGTNEGAESKNRTAKSDKIFKKFKVILIVSQPFIVKNYDDKYIELNILKIQKAFTSPLRYRPKADRVAVVELRNDESFNENRLTKASVIKATLIFMTERLQWCMGRRAWGKEFLKNIF